MLLRTFVGSSSLVVNLYGAPQHRRVESDTAPLRVVAAAPVERHLDRSVAPGEEVVQQYGTPAQSTSVHRTVYSAGGKLLSSSTWVSNYDSEPEIIAYGPKKKPEKPAKAKDKAKAGAAATDGAAADGTTGGRRRPATSAGTDGRLAATTTTSKPQQ